MDPALDPPPVSAQPTGAVPAVPAAPVPATSPVPNHLLYYEMISAAITALNESEGSTKRTIAKYIETHYPDLPPTHAALLDYHLKHFKSTGQLVLVKHSYNLPGRSTAPAVNGAEAASSGTKRRRGRPAKPKPDAVQAAVPVFGAPAIPPAGNVNGAPKRGRGRPPRAKTGAVVPSVGSTGRGRGRPKKNPAALVAARKGSGRPRGRPPKPINVVEGAAPLGGGIPAVSVSLLGKRRGRPPMAGGLAKKPRDMTTVQARRPKKRSGRPVGRPRKNAPAPESQLLVSYLNLQGKLNALTKKVIETAALIKPSLNGEAAINALQELEVMAANIDAPQDAQNQQQQQQQPQQQLPPPVEPYPEI